MAFGPSFGGGEYVSPFGLQSSSSEIVISTANVNPGNSQNILIRTGTATGTRGKIQLQDGS